MHPVLQVLRPLNCLMAAVGVLIGAIVTLGSTVITDIEPFAYLLSAMIVAFFATGTGNLLNDYFDRDTDKINHPTRPIPAGKLRPNDVLLTSILISMAIMTLAFFINLSVAIIVIIALFLMIGYELNLKKRGLAGNLTISALVALLFLLGGFSVSQNGINGVSGVNGINSVISRIGPLSALAFLTTLGREIVKDIEDIKGDMDDRATLPMTLGEKNARVVASLVLISAIVLSPIPYLFDKILGELNAAYIYCVIVADLFFAYSILIMAKSAHTASKSLKVGMIIALIAFMIGSVL